MQESDDFRPKVKKYKEVRLASKILDFPKVLMRVEGRHVSGRSGGLLPSAWNALFAGPVLCLIKGRREVPVQAF